MQPSNPLDTRIGSFSKPEPPRAAEARSNPEPSTEETGTAAAGVGQQDLEESSLTQTPAEDLSAKIKGWIKDLSKELNVSVDDADIKNYILKGRIAKEVTLVPGLMTGIMQTLRIEDLQSIDTKMSRIRDSSKFTPKGLENEEAILALAYAWTHADGKSLGDTPESREEKIRKMGFIFVEKASTARVNFDTLVRFVMRDRGVLKK